MTSLPKWVEDFNKDNPNHQGIHSCDGQCRLKRALAIAVEALENGSRHMKFKGHHSHDQLDRNVFLEALAAIEKLEEK